MSKSKSGSTSALKEIVQKSQHGNLMGVNPTYLKLFRYVSYFLFVGLIAILPNLVNGLQLRLATLASIWFVATMGLQVLMGQAGLVSIGQAAFVGVGAYTAAILATKHGFSFLLTIPIGGLSGCLLYTSPSPRDS